MSVLVVGGDKIGTIKCNLKQIGFDQIKHVTGRRTKDRQIHVPCNIDLVLVLTDFIGHKVVQTVKQQAKIHNKEVVYSKRAWSSIERNLKVNMEDKNKCY